MLAQRSLRISERPNFTGFEYQYEICLKEILGFCRKREMKIDYYDLADPITKKQLIDMGFILKMRDKVVP